MNKNKKISSVADDEFIEKQRKEFMDHITGNGESLMIAGTGAAQIIDMDDAKVLFGEETRRKKTKVDIKVNRSNDKVILTLTGTQKDVDKYHNIINTVKFNKKLSGMNVTFKYIYTDTNQIVEQKNSTTLNKSASKMKDDIVSKFNFSDEILKKLGF